MTSSPPRRHGPYRILSSAPCYRNRWMAVREDRIIRPGGSEGLFGVVEMMSGISALALDGDNDVYLVREFKYAIGRDSLEVISGGIDERETPVAAAQRELREEAGLLAAERQELGAATATLNGPQDCIGEMRRRYKGRRDVLIEGLAQAGWDVAAPRASMFAWAKIPGRFGNLGSVRFSKLLLSDVMVAVAPGLGFGEYGKGYVRIALIENRERLRQAVRITKRFMAKSAAA